MPILTHSAQIAGIESANETSAVDLMTDILATSDLAAASSNPNDVVRSQADNGYRFLGFNLRTYADPTISVQAGKDVASLVQQKAFRVGIDYLIPRSNIISTQLGGYGSVVCQAVSAGLPTFFNSSVPCRPTGSTAAANRTAALAQFATLLGGVFENKTGGCTNVATSWCFANSTSHNQIHIGLLTFSYDSGVLYAANQVSANARAVGLDVVVEPFGLCPLIGICPPYNYHFNMLIRSFGFGEPSFWLLWGEFNSVNDLCISGVDTPTCSPNSGNLWGLHDAQIDAFTNTMHNDPNYGDFFQAAKNVLGKIYADADFLAMFSFGYSYGERVSLYHGYFNRPDQGIGGWYTIPFEAVHVHRTDLPYDQTLVHPSDNPMRAFTLALSSDHYYVNRWNVGGTFGIILNSMYEGADTLNYQDATDYSLQPLVATLPKGTDLQSAVVGGQPGLIIKYRINPTSPSRPALYGGGPGSSSYGTLVTVDDYKNTLDYIKAERPFNFASLLAELYSYSTTCDNIYGPCPSGTHDTLEMDLNATAGGYLKLYDTNIFPTYAPYWCDASGNHSCLVRANNQHHWDQEPDRGNLDEYKMADYSTYGPFRLVSHVPGVSITVERQGSFVVPYWLSPADTTGNGFTDFAKITQGHCDPLNPACTPQGLTLTPSVIFSSPILTILLAIPVVLAVLTKRRQIKSCS